jgi:hypothetical protein
MSQQGTAPMTRAAKSARSMRRLPHYKTAKGTSLKHASATSIPAIPTMVSQTVHVLNVC